MQFNDTAVETISFAIVDSGAGSQLHPPWTWSLWMLVEFVDHQLWGPSTLGVCPNDVSFA